MEFNTIRRSAMLLAHEGDVPEAKGVERLVGE